MLNLTSATGATACVHPAIRLSVCFFAPFPPTSPPLHLQFQPFVQLVGPSGQEAGVRVPGERQVQRTHLPDSAVGEEEEHHLAAAPQ